LFAKEQTSGFGAADWSDNSFCGAAATESDDGSAAGLSFHRHDAEIFFARKEQGATPAEVIADFLVRLPAEERHIGPGLRLQSSSVLACPDHD
jgi:hypothetical protein